MNRRFLAGAAVLLLLAAGAGGFYFWKSRSPRNEKKPATNQQAPLPAGAVIQLQGTLQARNVVTVDVPVDGVLDEFVVKPGDEVFEGQILGSIKNDVLVENEKEAALDLERLKTRLSTLESQLLTVRLEESRQAADASRATSERQRAERAHQRQLMLHREGATPRKTFEAAQAAFETARAEEESLLALASSLRDRMTQIAKDIDVAKKQVAESEAEYDQAKAGLAAAQLLSPSDGVIMSIQKQAGEEVIAGMEGLIQVAVDLTMMEAVIDIEPALVPRMPAGTPAEIHVAEITGGLAGEVRLVENGKAYVEFASPTPLVRPGMTATVAVRLK
jgi:multidrug resistance efflux pump